VIDTAVPPITLQEFARVAADLPDKAVVELALGRNTPLLALDNHHLVEFYVVAHSWEWLVGENHHDVLFAVGDHAIAAVIVGTG
jgi:hypothetical protein